MKIRKDTPRIWRIFSAGHGDASASKRVNYSCTAPKIEIQGHADERGDDGYNLRLTSDRAAAVLDALVQRGVDPQRMRSAGYGERCPLQAAHDEAAWEKNRRVEFKILQTDAGPTGVEVTCPAGRALKPR